MHERADAIVRQQQAMEVLSRAARLNHQDIGHGRYKHEPDWTWGKRRRLSMVMAQTTYNQMVGLSETYKAQCTGRREAFVAFQAQVQAFVDFEPQIYGDVYEAGKFTFTVPDVVSYEDKVERLGLTTVGTPEAANRQRRVIAAQEREKRKRR